MTWEPLTDWLTVVDDFDDAASCESSLYQGGLVPARRLLPLHQMREHRAASWLTQTQAPIRLCISPGALWQSQPVNQATRPDPKPCPMCSELSCGCAL